MIITVVTLDDVTLSLTLLAVVCWMQVKWMMYWIVFAFFTCIETFADLFIAW